MLVQNLHLPKHTNLDIIIPSVHCKDLKCVGRVFCSFFLNRQLVKIFETLVCFLLKHQSMYLEETKNSYYATILKYRIRFCKCIHRGKYPFDHEFKYHPRTFSNHFGI